MKITVIQLLAYIFLPTTIFAQACCSGGTPLAGNIGLRPMSAGDVFFDLTYDYNTQRTLLSGSTVLDDNRRERNTNALLARAGYALTDHLSFTAILSWIDEEEKVQALSGGTNRLGASGLGDAIALVQYEPIKWRDKNLVFGGGIKFPLGSIDNRDPETGLILNPDLQPGSGSWDMVLGVHFQQSHFFKNNLTMIASVTSRLNTEADRFEGQQAYQFGTEFRTNFGFRDRYLLGTFLLDPGLILLYRRTEIDRIDGNEVPNTGGQWLHVLPNLNWQISPAFSVGASVEIPLYRNLTGTQLTTTNRFTFTLAYQISKQNKELGF